VTGTSLALTPTVAQGQRHDPGPGQRRNLRPPSRPAAPALPLPLNAGANTVEIRVTAQDGATAKSYILTVTRIAPPTVAAPAATDLIGTAATLGGNVTSRWRGGDFPGTTRIVYAPPPWTAIPLIGGARALSRGVGTRVRRKLAGQWCRA